MNISNSLGNLNYFPKEKHKVILNNSNYNSNNFTLHQRNKTINAENLSEHINKINTSKLKNIEEEKTKLIKNDSKYSPNLNKDSSKNLKGNFPINNTLYNKNFSQNNFSNKQKSKIKNFICLKRFK